MWAAVLCLVNCCAVCATRVHAFWTCAATHTALVSVSALAAGSSALVVLQLVYAVLVVAVARLPLA